MFRNEAIMSSLGIPQVSCSSHRSVAPPTESLLIVFNSEYQVLPCAVLLISVVGGGARGQLY